MKRFLFAAFTSLFLFVTGCAHQELGTIFGLKADTNKQTTTITTAVNAANSSIDSADSKIADVSAQATTPPAAKTELTDARTDLKNAKTALKPVTPATQNIDANAKASAEAAQKIQNKLDDERNHWLGYKTRSLLWWVFGFSLFFGVIFFVVRAFGGEVVLSLIGAFFKPVISLLATVGMFFVHIFTLGFGKLADKLNEHYEKTQAAKSASAQATPAPTTVK